MDELKIFENEQFGTIRAIQKDGEPWFVAADVCVGAGRCEQSNLPTGRG